MGIRSLLGQTSISDDIDVVNLREEVEGVSDKDPCFTRYSLLENILEDGFTDMGIECRERVLNDKFQMSVCQVLSYKMKTNIKNLDLSVAIDGTTNA